MWLALATLLSAGAVLGLTGTAAAQDDDDAESFTVTPTAIDAGEALTVVGKNCNGDEARVTVVSDSGSMVASVELGVAPTETWAGPIVVPDGIPTGTYEVRALCLSRGIPFGESLTDEVTIFGGDGSLPRTDEPADTTTSTSTSTTSTSTTSTSTTTTEAPAVTVTTTAAVEPDDSDVSQVDAPETGVVASSDDDGDGDSDVRVKGSSVQAGEEELALTGPNGTSGLSVVALSLVAFGLAVLGAAGYALTRRRPLSADYLMSIGQK